MLEEVPRFRVWDKTNKTMLYDNFALLQDKIYDAVFDEVVQDWRIQNKIDGVLMRRTNIPDADGRLIYEDDICLVLHKQIGVVQITDEGFALFNRGREIDWENWHLVVIGNRFETPTLYKEVVR